MIVRNKKAIEREKKLLLNDLLVRTGYTKPKRKNLDMSFQIYLSEKLHQLQTKLVMV